MLKIFVEQHIFNAIYREKCLHYKFKFKFKYLKLLTYNFKKLSITLFLTELSNFTLIMNNLFLVQSHCAESILVLGSKGFEVCFLSKSTE